MLDAMGTIDVMDARPEIRLSPAAQRDEAWRFRTTALTAVHVKRYLHGGQAQLGLVLAIEIDEPRVAVRGGTWLSYPSLEAMLADGWMGD